MGVNAQAMSGLIQDDNINKENQSPSIAGECSSSLTSITSSTSQSFFLKLENIYLGRRNDPKELYHTRSHQLVANIASQTMAGWTSASAV